MQRPERLHGKQIRDGNAADLRNAPQIVAHQVHDHQVLGALLDVARQHPALVRIGLRRARARSRALHRTRRDNRPVLFDEQLRASRQHRHFAGIDDSRVGDALAAAAGRDRTSAAILRAGSAP